jgi:uncharacterized delta-60 repeat protein
MKHTLYTTFAALALVLLGGPVSASAQTFNRLYEFGSDPTDGGQVTAGLVADANGVLYGVTAVGGNNFSGTVFKFTPGNPGTYTKLHSFGGATVGGPGGNQADGAAPDGGLVLSGSTLYGTTKGGGTDTKGTIFKINTDGSTYRVLKNFTGADGEGPSATLVLSGGVLYGSTEYGGSHGKGTIFKINASDTAGSTYEILTHFEGFTDDMTANDDGERPKGALSLDGTTLYGTTAGGGNNQSGTVFKLNTSDNSHVIIQHFIAASTGSQPNGGLVLSGGKLYGTTSVGGTGGSGTVFKVGTSENDAITPIKHFDGGDDGGSPLAGLILHDNLFYGTTMAGGQGAAMGYNGTIFKIDSSGFAFGVIKSFAASIGGDGPDGEGPGAPLLQYDGKLCGTTQFGGSGVVGILFSMEPASTAIAPTITDMTVPSAGSYKVGQSLSFTVNFSASVTVTGAPRIPLTIGSTTRYATYTTGSSGTALTFAYTVQAGDSDANGIAVTSPLELNGGTITATTGGTAATLTFTPPATTGVKVDTTSPTVSSVAITSATGIQNTFLNAGDVVSMTVTMSEATTVTGTPQLALTIGGTTVQANYASGSGNNALVFTYTILAAQTDADGISIAANSLALNGGTLLDAAGNAATLTHALVAANSGFKVDTTAPTVSIGAPSASSTTTGPVTYTVTYADANFSASTLANGNVTLNYTGDAAGTVAVTGSGTTRTVTISSITGEGTLGISIAAGTASDLAGNTAPSAGPSTTFNVVKANQTITFASLGNKTFGDAPFTVTATGGGSGEPVTFSIISNPAKATATGLNNSLITLTGAGTVIVRASQAGNANYNAADPVERTFTVAKANQTITFTAIPDKQVTDPAFNLSATASSGLTVSFTLDSTPTANPPAINGSQVTPGSGLGEFTITASQAGDDDYLAATTVQQSFMVFRFTKLADFAGSLNGAAPQGNLYQATDGAFYGTTVFGGTHNKGTIFKMTPDGTLTPLADFSGAATGANPADSLVPDANGDLWGLTVAGGANDLGAVFKVSPSGQLTLMASFDGAAHGANPWGGLLLREDGTFLGMTSSGGTADKGVIFSVTPAGVLTKLQDFDGAEKGAAPLGSLSRISFGGTDYYFGTTSQGGANNQGIFFNFVPGGISILTKYLDFNGASLGATPKGNLLYTTNNGAFYMLTSAGGANGAGALVFHDFNTVTNLADFSATEHGSIPNGALLWTTNGNFFGLAQNGGTNNIGTIFRAKANGSLKRMASFPVGGGVNGANPADSLIQGADGALYGTTSSGGANNLGTVFKIEVGLPVLNQAPTGIALDNTSIAEHNLPNATVGTLSATDQDNPTPSQTHTFALVAGAGSADNSAFSISGSTLTINSPADYESKITYNIRIRATDSGSPALASEEAFTINITDLPDPEIAVSGNGVNIADGDTTPSGSDHTDFANAALNGGNVVRTFTIANTGDELVLSGNPKVVVSGTHASDFTVTTQPTSPVAANTGTTTFQVTFDPSSAGLRTAILSIANNDADENPFDFAIQGTGIVSSVATLSELTLSAGTLSPAFASGTTAYTVALPSETTSLMVTPTAAHVGASIQVRVNGGTYALVASGSSSSGLLLNTVANTVEIKVTAEDGTTTRAYSLTVVRAQYPGGVDYGFNPNANQSVHGVAVQADGKVLIGGYFTSVGGQTRKNIARLNADGTLDTGFNPSVLDTDTGVKCVTVQADGKVLIGGRFTSVGGQTRNHIARLNADGTLDTGFNPILGAPNHLTGVFGVAVQADGKVLIGGSFTSVGGQTRNHIARLNANGTLDTGFNPILQFGGIITTFAVQADGKVLIGGRFTSVGSQTHNHIARLNADGTLDTSFNSLILNAGSVYSVAVQADGKVLIGGYFTSVGGQTRNNIARLNADGTLDTGFYPNVNYFVESMAVQADGKVMTGGRFTSVGGQTRNSIARLNADGTLDTDFNPNANSIAFSVAVQADGKVLIGGFFTSIGGQTRNHIARLLNDPATQSLTIESTSRIQWLRGGSSPEAQHVTFELSTDGGNNYTLLGTGRRINNSSNWELTGFTLPVSGQIRARARTTGGLNNGSSGLVETVAAYPPETVTADSSAALTLNNKELRATGDSTLSGSTTLSGSVTISGSPVRFSNPGTVTLNGNTTLNVANTVTISGPLTANPAGSTLVKSGPGTLVLDGANFNGTITLTEGTVIVRGPNGNTCFTVGGSATLAGTGNISCVVLTPGSTISPGASPGTLATGDTEWNRSGSYDWEINDATGAAGANPGWDLLNITGPLNLTAIGTEPFTVRLKTLNLADEPGSMVNFNNNNAYSWIIASASGGIQGYVPGRIRLDTTGVANALGGGAFTLGVQNSGRDLVLSFLPAAQNSAPTDILLLGTTLAEANAINAVVGLLSPVDANAGDNHTYTLVSGTGDTDNASFNIAGSALRAAVALDFETKASYSVRVRATDAGGLTFEKQFTITVTDVVETITFDATQIAFRDGEIQLSLNGTGNLSWRIEGSSNLSTWDDLGTYTLSPEGTLNFTDPAAATEPRRFYRVVMVTN